MLARRLLARGRSAADHLSAAPTSANSLLRLVPSADRAPIRNTAINEAIRAYSIAVAPDSSARKDLNTVVIVKLPALRTHARPECVSTFLYGAFPGVKAIVRL